MRVRAVVLGAILPVAVLLTSCTQREDTTLAEFADEKITVGEFEKAYAVVNPEYLPKKKGIEGWREFLTTMINKEVMAYKADELGYDKDPAVVQAMEAFKKMGLQAGYMKRKVADQVEVTDADVQEHYRNRDATMSVKQILLDTPPEADEVIAALDAGADFESVCKKYSKSPDASEGGQVMTLRYGRLAPDFQQRVFRTKVGDYTDPIFTPYGFFVVKVLRRTDSKTREPLSEIRETVEQEVRVMKEAIAANAHTEKLREEYGVSWFWDNLTLCYNALPPDRQYDQAPSRKDEVYPLLYFDEEDLEKPVATYGEKMILVKDFSDYYDQASFYARPRRDFRVAGVRTFVMERIMADLVQREMKRSRIEEDPEVKAAMEGKREQVMIDRLWDDMVNKQTTVTDRMVRDYYDANTESFNVPERRRFGVILTNSFDDAQRAYDELKSGTLFRTVAMAYSVDPNTRETLGETPLLTEGEQPEMDAVGFALDGVGAISEPFETSRGWMVLKVTEVEEGGQYTMEQARDAIVSALTQQINEERLNELLDKWKEELNVTIYEENLEKIQIEERSPVDKPAA